MAIEEIVLGLTSDLVGRIAVAVGTHLAALGVVTQQPGVQLLLVTASYERPTDIEYRIYQKDYTGAYADLKSGTMSKDRTFFEDMLGDGLQPVPAKNQIGDAVTVGTEKRVFDGDFDPKNKNPKKISQDDYVKAFSSADETYARLIGALLTELKKKT